MFPTARFFQYLFTKEEVASFVLFEVVLGIIASLTSLLLFVYISNAVLKNQTVFIDNAIASTVYSIRQPWLTKIMLFASFLGSEVIIFTSVITVIFLTMRKHRRETIIFSTLLVMGVITTTGLKLIYKVPRPNFIALAVENSYSYPSGHALNSFLFYCAISYFIFHLTKKKFLSFAISTVSMFIIFFVGLSRIYLGVHHPSDVLAGYIAGFWLFATVILMDKTIAFFRLIRESSRSP